MAEDNGTEQKVSGKLQLTGGTWKGEPGESMQGGQSEAGADRLGRCAGREERRVRAIEEGGHHLSRIS